MLGALCHYVTHADPADFQPMKANLGILPELEAPSRDKRLRKQQYASRAISDMRQSITKLQDPLLSDEKALDNLIAKFES